jgi:uncharacterized protein YheU (UPF0270 family)
MSSHTEEKGIIVPHRELSQKALKGLLMEFVSRDGTDSGYTRLSHDQRMEQVKRQLDRGEAFIVYDEISQSANIVPRENLAMQEK